MNIFRIILALGVFGIVGCGARQLAEELHANQRKLLVKELDEQDRREALLNGSRLPVDQTNDVQLDATNEQTLSQSYERMTNGWGKAKRFEFDVALGTCIFASGAQDETDQARQMSSLQGMTADEIFAKAKSINLKSPGSLSQSP